MLQPCALHVYCNSLQLMWTKAPPIWEARITPGAD